MGERKLCMTWREVSFNFDNQCQSKTVCGV